MSEWKKFGEDDLNGLYWICGYCEETDDDTTNFGNIAEFSTSSKSPFVSLVYIEFSPDDPANTDIEPINYWYVGDFDDRHTITHYMPLEVPKHCETK